MEPIVIEGQYNEAYIKTENIDESTLSQIYSILSSPALSGSNIVIMPDCHAGKGSCIGFTSTLTDKVIPNIVGVDINCGMLMAEIPFDEIDFQELDDHIRNKIPFGFNIHDDSDINLEEITEEDRKKFLRLSTKVGQKSGKAIESLGTLGGGNHYIEVDKSEDGKLYLTIHTGSRNLGLRVADYHQNIAKDKRPSGTSKDLAYLEGEDAEDYFSDMKTAQEYAELNRYIIMKRIFRLWDIDILSVPVTECVHNYINFEDNIIRKGAISAHEGEDLIIPLNMRDGTVLAKGKGLADWNYSAPHGAGRIMSRKQAKKGLDIDGFRDSMQNVWSSCVSESTLDESPEAYKSKEEIMKILEDSVDVKEIIKPVYNFKA